MINNWKSYKKYLQADLEASGIADITCLEKIMDRRYRFYKSLRRTEYFTNCYSSVLGKFIAKILRFRHNMLCNKYNWTIPINVFEEGLAIVHVGTIVVSGNAKVGKNCRINVCTNIGRASINGGRDIGAPILGDNVYLGPGVKIFGPVFIGSNTAIGANAVVNKSFPEGNCTIAGVPAKKVSGCTSERYILRKKN